MFIQDLSTELLFDLPLVQQQLVFGGINSNNKDGSFDKFKYKDKDKEKQKDKNVTNIFVFQKDINGPMKINLTISM